MIVTGGVKNGDIMGPVGVGSAMNEVIEEAKDISTTQKEAVINVILNLLNWSILLSVNLGIMNLLPIPHWMAADCCSCLLRQSAERRFHRRRKRL